MLLPLICANTIIKKALESQTPLSPMKLQKLLYLTYARALHKHGDEGLLFSEQFEKWQYGPVLRSVYDEFKCFSAQPIDKYHRDCNGNIIIVGDGHEKFYDCFKETWDKFGHNTGIRLSEITHQEESAWTKAQGILLQKEDVKVDGKKLFEAAMG